MSGGMRAPGRVGVSLAGFRTSRKQRAHFPVIPSRRSAEGDPAHEMASGGCRLYETHASAIIDSADYRGVAAGSQNSEDNGFLIVSRRDVVIDEDLFVRAVLPIIVERYKVLRYCRVTRGRDQPGCR